jgi:multidrug efflux pump subunit AcrA (membrane-fusion protein)
MADVSVAATLISTIGALLGALGGTYLTNRVNLRREEVQADLQQAQADRQRKDQQTQARREAYDDLLSTARQLRAENEITGQKYWKDMNVRLATIQQHAVSVGRYASRAALLSSKTAPETAEAAGELELAARRLTAATATHTDLGYQDEQFLGGQVTLPADFTELTEFDECIERFSRAAAQDSEE